jgi:predicted dehydrogenase
MDKIRTAVVGVGAFGQNHARVLAGLPEAELVAVVDVSETRAREVAGKFGCEAISDYRRLIGKADAVCVAVPTESHAEVGAALLEAGIDVLVEKPLAANLDAADQLIEAAAKHNRILQAGHLERFNPAVEEAIEAAVLPLFFEVHRLSTFAPRSLDIDVVLDLMIHDLDIVLAMVDSPLDRVEAAGVPILSRQADIASVRLVFENGCVANLTASRVSTEKVRKLRFFQPRQYVSVDYTAQDGVAIGLDDNNIPQFRKIAPEKAEPLVRQSQAFLHSVATREQPRVSGAQVRKALETALRIRAEMETHAGIIEKTIAAHGKR